MYTKNNFNGKKRIKKCSDIYTETIVIHVPYMSSLSSSAYPIVELVGGKRQHSKKKNNNNK